MSNTELPPHSAEENNPAEEHEVMPLSQHLLELRQRLIYAVWAFLVAFILCFAVANRIFDFLVAPLIHLWGDDSGRKLIFTALQEKFFTNVRVAFFAAMMLASPIIACQIWLFVAPGLYKKEKNAMLPFLLATPVMFSIGAAVVYYAVLPVAWKFFLSFEQHGADGVPTIELAPRVSEYLSLVMQMMFGFGLVFELPVLLLLLVKVGLLNIAQLKAFRRYMLVLAFVAAAVLTPPDPLSQIAMAIPLYLLYEAAIFLARFINQEKKG
ncbi:MAG: twin-arginine translocase subunit TatC [Alphaproteobacteria bacterium]